MPGRCGPGCGMRSCAASPSSTPSACSTDPRLDACPKIRTSQAADRWTWMILATEAPTAPEGGGTTSSGKPQGVPPSPAHLRGADATSARPRRPRPRAFILPTEPPTTPPVIPLAGALPDQLQLELG